MRPTGTIFRCALLALGILAAGCGGGAPQADVVSAVEPLPADAVPFRFDRHLYFDATVADTLPVHLVFDTGATGLYLDSLWLIRSGLAPERTMRAYMPGGAGSRGSMLRVLLDTLRFRVDTVSLQSTMTPIIDLKGVLGRQADGIFGQEYLADKCVGFDLRRGCMRAVVSDTLAAAGFTRVPVGKRGCRIFVDVRVRFDSLRILEGQFLLDMGSSGTVTVTADAARKAGFDGFAGRQVVYHTVSGGIGGEASSSVCRAREVMLGGFSFEGVPVEVSRNRAGFLAKEDHCGLIGNGLLERFDFVIDFAAPALWLRPATGAGRPFPYPTPGFTSIDRTDTCAGWVVTGLFEGIAPEGVRTGDIITEWDGRPVDGMANPDSLQRAPGRHRMATLRGGGKTLHEIETKEIL